MSQEVNIQTAKELGLLPEEYLSIQNILGRNPNFTELSIFSVMWSEHCSYKNSITWLKKLPKDGPHVLAKAGEENAGLMDIGDGLACAFKIESHNHPSAIEPYQGAATGVGGINRDIFSMGARPIAQLNSLRFGNIDTARTQWLLKGVVKGIGDYGNAFGIPTVGGEVYFDDCYETNILVNAMSVGIVEVGKTISAIAEGEGNPVYIFGSATGKDGIHGAAFASKDISEDSVNDLPSVQVGDPFWEKLILEASMELLDTNAIIGMQDMGAAGITCSTAEMSAKSKTGMKIYLDKVPMRQEGMKAWEILLSESQERMLAVVKKGEEEKVQAILNKWDLTWAEIGNVTNTGRVEYYMNGVLEADVPAGPLSLGGGAPIYQREYEKPAYIDECETFEINQISQDSSTIDIAKFLIQEPNIASKKWIFNQYDSMVGTINQSTNKPSDAAVVKIKNTSKSLAITTDCNSRYIYANPEKGCAIAVAEAARNIVCSGGNPLGVTNCINFGNPYDKGVYYQFVNAIMGMKMACESFNTPVTGGNVSFYNQNSDGKAVFPTPTIGMVGLIADPNWITPMSLQNENDYLILLGTNKNDIGSSQYLAKYHKVEYSNCPEFEIDEELLLHKSLTELIHQGLINSAHDIAEGGLWVCLAEKTFHNEIGFEINVNIPNDIREDAFWFGECQSRVVISANSEKWTLIETLLINSKMPYTLLGKSKGTQMLINDINWGSVNEIKNLYDTAIEKRLH